MRFRARSQAVSVLGFACALAISSAPSFAAQPAQPRLDKVVPPVVERVELVVKCWETPSGRRRCRTVYVNPYTYNNPNRFPVGSTEWWRAMDRNGSGGYRR